MKNQNGKKRKNGWKWALLVLLLFFLALIVAAVIFVVGTLNKINRADPNATYLDPEAAETLLQDDEGNEYGSDGSEVAWPEDNDHIIGEGDDITNILLIGQDRRPGEIRARSDAMILVSFNKNTGAITMVSFLRDNYVQIPDGYRDNRLNAAYAFGGMPLLDASLELNFGVHVDANVEVDFDGFIGVIDKLGGVDVELTAEEAAYLNGSRGTKYVEGMNHMSGSSALAYARIRKLDSDFGRTSRQRRVLDALFKKFKNIGVSEALDLSNELLPMLTTDMTNGDIIHYVLEFLPMMAKAPKISSLSIPGDCDYYYSTIRGMSVLVPDLVEARRILVDTLE